MTDTQRTCRVARDEPFELVARASPPEHDPTSIASFAFVRAIYGQLAAPYLVLRRRGAADGDGAGAIDWRLGLRLERTVHATPPEFEVVWHEDRIYEVCAVWRRVDATAAIHDAFVAAVRPALERHGARPLLVFACDADRPAAFAPDAVSICEWPTLEHFMAFVTEPYHAEVTARRARAFARMDAVATRLVVAASDRYPSRDSSE